MGGSQADWSGRAPGLLTDYRVRQRVLIAGVRGDPDAVRGRASTVPMQADFAADPSRCLTIVAFVPATITRVIADQVQTRLRAAEAHHYVCPRASLHVTIKNVRTAADPPRFGPPEISVVRRMLRAVAPTCPSVTFSFEELVAFPNSVSLVGYSDETLRTTVQTLDKALTAAGLPDDKHYLSDELFFGNITLCRFTQAPTESFLQAVAALRLVEPITLHVAALELISCNAAAAPATISRHGRFNLQPGRRD